MAIVARLQNIKLKNTSIVTNAGMFSFNSEGVILASKLPKDLVEELSKLDGFKPLDKNGNEIIPTEPETTEPESVPEIKPIIEEKPGEPEEKPASK